MATEPMHTPDERRPGWLARGATALAALSLGMAAAWGPQAVGQDTEKPVILVFTSVADARSTAIVDAFKQEVGEFAIRMSYDLSQHEDAAYFISDNLRGMDVSLVLAVGDKALKAAAREFVGTPVIYTDARADASLTVGRQDVIGVARRVDPKQALERLQVLMPSLDSVGAIYSTRDAGAYWTEVEKACKELGIAYQAKRIATPAEVTNAQAALMSSTDLLYIQDDDAIWTASTLSRTFHDASIATFPVVSFSLQHFESPQRPAVVFVTDPNGVGLAAARIARELLMEKRPIDQLSPGYPAPVVWGERSTLLKSRVLLTKKTTKAIDSWHE